MNAFIWIDWVILGLIAISALVSLFRGFVREAVSLAGWIVAAWVSLTFFDEAAVYLPEQISAPSARLAMAWLALFMGVLLLTGIVSTIAGMIVDKTGMTGTDRVLGMVFGAARGAVIVALLVLAAGMTPLPQDPWWREAALIGQFERLAVTIRETLPPEVANRFGFS